MKIVTSIVIQALLLAIALIVTVLRCWVRIRISCRSLVLADYLVWCGWACTAGWFICSIKALRLQIDHPLHGEDLVTDSADYLTTVFVAQYFFDIGIFFPKAALCAFYAWLVPRGLTNIRIALYACISFLAMAFVTTLLTDTLIAPKISDNWSIENQLNSTWNSYTCFAVAWALNFSTDIVLFCFPFFLISGLKLHRRQKIGLIGVFSLGLITMTICLSRFIVYTVTDFGLDDASGNAWSTAEMCTAVIVVSLPSLKPLIVRTTPTNSSNRSTNGYVQHKTSRLFHDKATVLCTSGQRSDDELELFDGAANPMSSRSYAGSQKGAAEMGKDVVVTTDVVITRT
ncbi:hypothetical protein ACN47E_010250 [Coniothyrium glycines]